MTICCPGTGRLQTLKPDRRVRNGRLPSNCRMPLKWPGRSWSWPQIELMTIVSKSPRDWINENVKQLDAPVLNMGDVRTRDGHSATGRARPPEESRGAVVAHSMPGRGEDEIWRQAEVQVVNSSRDRLPSGRDVLGVVEGCVLGIELAQCCAAAVRVSLVENTHDISLHQCVEINPVCRPRSSDLACCFELLIMVMLLRKARLQPRCSSHPARHKSTAHLT